MKAVLRLLEGLALGTIAISGGALVGYWVALRAPAMAQAAASVLGAILGWAWTRPLVHRDEPAEHEPCKVHTDDEEEP